MRSASAALADLLHGRAQSPAGRVDLRRDLAARPLAPLMEQLATAVEPAAVIEGAIADVLGGTDAQGHGAGENDRFNELVVSVGFAPRPVALLRALFRYLRQTGLTYSLLTVADALRRHPAISRAIVDLFEAHHGPHVEDRDTRARAAEAAIERYLEQLHEVARLDIRAICEEPAREPGGPTILHVIGRTPASPHVYHHRQRIGDGSWTAWEKVDVDIEGDPNEPGHEERDG